MTTFPFTTDIDRLAERLDEIPIDLSVPFATEFQSLLAGNEELWGPQASDRSKLATRLHFAGWSRQELESVGLKPKDVENFRRKYKLTARSAGRPKVKSRANTGAPESSTIKEILATAEARRADLAVQIKQKRMEGERLEQELLQIEEAIKALQS